MHAAVRIAILASILGTGLAQAAELAIHIDNVESNDAQGFMGPPAFEAARLTLADADRAVTVSLR
jgi:uncharacterized protein (DUF2141 family)